MNFTSQTQEMFKETQLVPVHVSWDEVLYFNYLQELVTNHQQDVDKKTGLRAYPGLSQAIRIPEIREIFMATVEMLNRGEHLGNDISAITEKEDKKIRQRGIPPIPSDEEKDIQKLDATGQGDDKVLVMMPLDVVRFLDILRGSENKDPTLHLDQFGWFKSIVRTVATVGGALLGGPLGAVAGNIAGRVATGQPVQKAIVPSLPNALYAWGGGHGLNAAGLGAYAGASAPGSTAAWGSSLLGNGAANNGATTSAATGAAKAAASGAAAEAGKEAANSGFGNLVKQYGPGLALIGGGLFLGHKKDKQKQQHYEEEKQKFDKANTAAIQRWNEDELERPLLSPEPIPEHLYRRTLSTPRRLKKGGEVIGKPIVGKGKGQEDLIYVDVPENTWIHNATFVSDAGDGSTDAGHKEIEKLEKFAVKKLMTPEVVKTFKENIKEKPLRQVPCALSNGERKTPPIIVSALGAGSHDKGANIMRDVVKEMRLHKISKGHKLPPPAPDLISLYKKVARKHLGGEVCH